MIAQECLPTNPLMAKQNQRKVTLSLAVRVTIKMDAVEAQGDRRSRILLTCPARCRDEILQ